MGTILMAECPCGMKMQFKTGGGRLNFHTTCYFPYICENCSAIIQVNMMSERKECPHCMAAKIIPYDDPRLSGRAGSKMVDGVTVEGRDHLLNDGSYKCPKCNQYNLYFWCCGDWD